MKQFEEVLDTVGTFGRYQKLHFAFILLVSGFIIFAQLGNTFYSASADHYCRVYNNQTYTDVSPVKNCTIPYTMVGDDIVWNKCKRYNVHVNASQEVSAEVCFPRSNDTLSCDQGWVYDNTWYENTVVFEYDLVCDNDWMKQLSKSIVPLGNLIGVVVFGQISDIFGRRIVFIITLTLSVVVSLGTAFSPTYVVFIIGQFCLGLFPMAMYMSGLVLSIEMVGTKYRTMCATLMSISTCICYMLLGVIAWLCSGHWRKIQLIGGIVWAALLPLVFLITESPMWLMQKHKYDKCEKVLKRFAKFNKTTLPENIFEEEKKMNFKREVDTPKERKYTLFDLLKTPRLRIRTLVICYSWFTTGFVFYGISLNTDQIGSNPYITFILSGFVEIPARLLAWWLMGVIGRRWSLAGCHIICSIALILSIIPQNPNVATAMVLLSKFCISAVFMVIYVYSPEIYPTVVRNAGMGVSSMCSGVGNIISPYAMLLEVHWAPLPFVIMFGISVIAGLTAPFLPETRNERLPGTIEEGEVFGTETYKQNEKEHAKPQETMKRFDQVLNTVGNFGRYQKLLCFFIFMITGSTLFHQVGNTFYSASDDHYCRVHNNQTFTDVSPVKNCTIPYVADGDEIVWKRCKRYDVNASKGVSDEVCFPRSYDTLSCDQGWVYDKTWYKNTVVFEYDLVCDKEWMKQLSKSIVPLGNIIGVVTFGQISDIFGRRIVFIITLTTSVIVSIGTAFSPSYIIFLIGQFCLGAFPISLFVSCQVLMVEMVGMRYRTMCTSISLISCCIFYMLLGVIAWLCNGDWRKIQLVVGLTWALFLPLLFVLPESPMWLMQKQKYDKCLEVLKRFAKFNKTNLPDDIFEGEKKMLWKARSTADTSKERKYTLIDLLRTPRLRLRTMVMCFNWFSCGFVYYGISLNTDQIGDNPYITFILAGFVEIPARLLGWWLMGFIGRRWSLCGFQMLGGVALILSIMPQAPKVSEALAMLSKFCIAAVYGIIYVYGAEIYPTVVRNAGMGMSSMSAGIGSIISPYVMLLEVKWSPLPFVIMGCLPVIAGLIVPLLPETRNERLPGTIEEGQILGTGQYSEQDKDRANVNHIEERQPLLPDDEPNSVITESLNKYGALNDKQSIDRTI
ncbi:uncharacterized protein LOC144434013 [Glandiceps talaboti]